MRQTAEKVAATRRRGGVWLRWWLLGLGAAAALSCNSALSRPATNSSSLTAAGEDAIAAQRLAAIAMPDAVFTALSAGLRYRIENDLAEGLDAAIVQAYLKEIGVPVARPSHNPHVITFATSILDPYWKQRQAIIDRIADTEVRDFFRIYLPEFRHAVAKVYLSNLTAAELQQLDAEAASGKIRHKLAELTPHVFEAANIVKARIMSELNESIPLYMDKAAAEVIKLGPVRQAKDLSAAQRSELNVALGVQR